MRALMGLVLLLGIGLLGLENLGGMVVSARQGGQAAAPAALQSGLTDTPSAVVRTIAVAEGTPLPAVEAAPQAPKAAPIDPIVTPVPRAAPKAAVTGSTAAAKPAKPAKASKPAASSRPGFKLTCTAAQKLDEARQKCLPLKNKAVADAKKLKA
jgi:hypothetical protein